uniref:Metalloproteinase inhibitor 4 n=1 Tax=Zosterops lateralis melanops TaxID=1220523 RepID=A0A8D2PZJ2_ZOSLA
WRNTNTFPSDTSCGWESCEPLPLSPAVNTWDDVTRAGGGTRGGDSSTFCCLLHMFKGFEKLKDVQYVYTPFDSSLCGVKLEANNKKQYLLTGKMDDGKVLIHLCNYIEPWDDLSLSQKKSLNQRYQMGCGCKITTCYMVPCSITAPNECLWTDWLIERRLYGHQARHYACIKRSDGTCSWYRGGPPPEKEFIDISEP